MHVLPGDNYAWKHAWCGRSVVFFSEDQGLRYDVYTILTINTDFKVNTIMDYNNLWEACMYIIHNYDHWTLYLIPWVDGNFKSTMYMYYLYCL